MGFLPIKTIKEVKDLKALEIPKLVIFFLKRYVQCFLHEDEEERHNLNIQIQ